MFKLSMIGGALAASMLFATSAYAAPPPNRIVIDVVTANGSGCPIGSTAVAMSPDNTAFTVTYSRYLAQTGAGADPVAFRRNCQLNLNVHVPNGLTFAVISVDYRGFGHLERGATGLHQANYYFQGQALTQRLRSPFRGPMDRNWHVRDQAAIAERVYRPCGVQRNLNINTELRVSLGSSNPRRVSFLTMDSTDSAISTVYHLAWKRCGR
ncbi:DUF4360 domain-containing protein [Luedemannella helvata]|uniref:DUF4360 domain-containing protein n=2 Tax=Luedemannella helvata TaxID=349315 RepID=A0ABN2K849_9ACTN